MPRVHKQTKIDIWWRKKNFLGDFDKAWFLKNFVNLTAMRRTKKVFRAKKQIFESVLTYDGYRVLVSKPVFLNLCFAEQKR